MENKVSNSSFIICNRYDYLSDIFTKAKKKSKITKSRLELSKLQNQKI